MGDISPGAQVQGETEGLILAWPQLGQGPKEEQNGGGDSPKPEPERRSGEEEGPSSQSLAQGPDCLELGEARFLPGFGTKC
jgi:hypothetical protein